MALAGCVAATPDAREVVGDAMTAVGDAMADAGRAIGDSGASAQASDSVEVACDRTHTTAGGTYAYAEARIDTDGVTGVDVALCGRAPESAESGFPPLDCSTGGADYGDGVARAVCGLPDGRGGWSSRWARVRFTPRH